jgi:hypothetical protein
MILSDSHREALLLEQGIPQELINEARAAGFSLQQLLALLVQYGPQILAFLAAIFGWTAPLPSPAPPIVLPASLLAKVQR